MVDAAPLSANEIGLGGDSVKVEDSPRLLELSRGLLAVLIILKKASNCSVGAQDRPENQGFWTLLLHCTKANPGVALVQDAKRHA
jgi:hypothetical protein